MSKVVNLNKARKARARVAKAAQADQNAVKFGRTKARKAVETAQADKARHDLDGHKAE